MYNEFTFTAVALAMVWMVLLLLDLLCSGIVAIAGGLRFGRVFCWGLLSLLVPVALMSYGILVERNCFKVNKIELSFEGLPDGFDGYRLVHISDIHSRSFRLRPKALGRAVDKVNSLSPDLIAFTGDLITIGPGELDVTAPILSKLRAPDGVVSILGNHDYCTHLSGRIGVPDDAAMAELERRERALGWTLLLNGNTTIRRLQDSLAVVGVENISRVSHFPSTGDLQKASVGTDGSFRILLSHDPQHWETEVLGQDYPLTLSGHTHAAQTSILGWSPSRLVFKHFRGLYREGGQYLYVNIGLGETAYPVRIGAVPEITLITLRKDRP